MTMSTPSNASNNLVDIAEGRFNSRNFVDIPFHPPTFVRMIVLDVISDPLSELNNEGRVLQWQSMRVSNMSLANVLPRNTIIAKRVGEHDSPMFIFPFFPSHLSLPCKPGEAVWVMFEMPNAGKKEIGYWFCRIVEPQMCDDVNHAHPGRSFETTMNPNALELADAEKKGTAESGEHIFHELRNAPVVTFDKERYSARVNHILPGEPEDVFERLLTGSYPSRYASYESVPRFRKRPGDVALEGSNNTLIVLGTDRTGSINLTEYPVQAGCIDLVAGRGQTENTSGKVAQTTSIQGAGPGTKGPVLKDELNKTMEYLSPDEGDPDFINDRSRILISQKTRPDARFNLSDYNGNLGVSDDVAGNGAIVIKSDKVRLIARSDLQIVVTSFDTTEAGITESDDTKRWSSITVKSNGDIVFTPSEQGYIKLGGEDADKAIVCTATPASAQNGVVSGAPIITTMGGSLGGATPGQNDNSPSLGSPRNGKYASKVLIK